MKFDCVSIGAWAAFDKIWSLDSDLVDGGTAQVLHSEYINRLFFGDCSFNVAVGAKNLGLHVGVVSVVGQDFVDLKYAKFLQDRDIDISGVTVLPTRLSGYNINITTSAGTTFCITQADASLEQDKVTSYGEAIENASWVVVSEKFSEYTLQAVRIAKNHGSKVLINGSIGNGSFISREILSMADVLVTNKSEFDALRSFGMEDLTPPVVVITFGSKGAEIHTGEGIISIPPVSSSGIIDTTGAGDSLVAGLVAGLVKGFSLEDSVRIGACAASLVITEVGCQSRQYDWHEVLEIFEAIKSQENAHGE